MRHTTRSVVIASCFCALFCAVNAIGQQQMRLEDENGKPVKNARVYIKCDDNPATEGVSDAGGTAKWKPLPGSLKCSFIIYDTPQTESLNGSLFIPETGVFNGVYVLRRKSVWVVQVTVLDTETMNIVPGVEVKFDCGYDTYHRTTSGEGIAELDKILAATSCIVSTEHARYEPFSTTVAVPKGQTKPVSHVIKIKPKINIKNVKITVVDSETSRPVVGARVLLSGRFFSGGSGVTNETGVAEIVINRPGDFEVEVRHDSYLAVRYQMLIEPGAAGDALNSSTSLVKKPRNDGAELVVSVKGKRLDGTLVDLSGATISVDGRTNYYTGANGKVTIPIPSVVGDAFRVMARADGYDSSAKDMFVPRFLSSTVTPDTILILNESKDAIKGVSLVIEVTDMKDGSPVAGAAVALAGKAGTSSTVTDARGYVHFSINAEAIKNEQYLRYTVRKEGYVEKWSDVSADILKPSEEPRYYSIQLVKQSPIAGGSRWDEAESGHRGVWLRRGNTDIWDARWGGITAELTITISGNNVNVVRRKSSDGNDCTYTGTIGPDGITVKGLYSCNKFATSTPWSATINR